MTRRVTAAIVAALLLGTLFSGAAWAKTNLTRLLIEGPGLATPLEITGWRDLETFESALRETEPLGSTPQHDLAGGYRVEAYRQSQAAWWAEYRWASFTYYPDPEGHRGYVKNSPYPACDASECWGRASQLLDSWMASHLPSSARGRDLSQFFLYVVTAHHEVLVVDPESGTISNRIPIGSALRPNPERPGLPARPARPLTISRTGERVYALDHDPDLDGDLTNAVGIRVIDASSQAIETTHTVPMSDPYSWTGLVLSPAEDLVYILGQRLVEEDTPLGMYELKVLAIDLPSGRVAGEYQLYPGGTVYQGATDSANAALYIAYHGAATGLDILDLATGQFVPRNGEHPRIARIVAHGGVVRGPDGRIYTPANQGAVLLAIEPSRYSVYEELETGLGRSTHMPEMAASPTEDVLYLLGSCTYGVSKKLYALNVRTGESRELATGNVCGHRLAVGPNGRILAILAKRPPPTRSVVLIIDAHSGEVLSSISLNAPGMDLISAPASPMVLPATGKATSQPIALVLLVGLVLLSSGILLRRGWKGAGA